MWPVYWKIWIIKKWIRHKTSEKVSRKSSWSEILCILFVLGNRFGGDTKKLTKFCSKMCKQNKQIIQILNDNQHELWAVKRIADFTGFLKKISLARFSCWSINVHRPALFRLSVIKQRAHLTMKLTTKHDIRQEQYF